MIKKIFFFFFLCVVISLINYRLHLCIIHSKQTSYTFFLPASFYCSYKALFADFYWFKLLTTENHKALFNQSCFITELDPNFSIVYRYAAVLLLRQHEHDLAYKLIKKGFDSSLIVKKDPRMQIFFEYFLINYPEKTLL